MTFVLELLVSLLIVAGGSFLLIGSIGMVKLPDLLTRLHAPTKRPRSAWAARSPRPWCSSPGWRARCPSTRC